MAILMVEMDSAPSEISNEPKIPKLYIYNMDFEKFKPC